MCRILGQKLLDWRMGTLHPDLDSVVEAALAVI